MLAHFAQTIGYLDCELHEAFLDRWRDFQSLQLTDEPPEEEEEDPFTAKLMSFEVNLEMYSFVNLKCASSLM